MANSKVKSFNKKHCIDFAKFTDHRKNRYALAKSEGPYSRPNLTIQTCKICTYVTSLVCPKCLLTPYCSPDCWKKDAANHSLVCGKEALYSLIKDCDGFYRYVVGNKNLSQGMHVLINDVPVILPTLPEGLLGESTNKPVKTLHAICFGCHQHFCPGKNHVVCSGCGIAKCSKYCAGVHHSEVECEVLKLSYNRNFSIFNGSAGKYIELYLDVCVLRVLRSFLHGDTNAFVAERYRKFCLLSTTLRFKQFHKMKRDIFDDMPYLKLVKSVDRLQMSLKYTLYNREIVQQVFKTMIVFWEHFEIIPGVVSRLLFIDRHFMTQSYCAPNVAATVMFEGNKSLPTWITYTTKEINVNRDASLAFLFDYSPSRFMSLPLRMKFLNDNGFSPCCPRENLCRLCHDSSDGGTHSGSIKCLKCGQGLYIEKGIRNVEPLLAGEVPILCSPEYVNTVDWHCNTCGDVQPFSLILEVNVTFEKIYMDKICKKFGACLLSDICKFIDSCEKHLHASNGVILRAKYDFVMAAREKHLRQCGYTATGLPMDPYYYEKLELGVYKDKCLRLALFPVAWNSNELRITQIRARYAFDCLKYLEDIRLNVKGKAAMENHTDFSFVRVERIILELLNSCHLYLQKHPDGKQNLARNGRIAVKTIQDYYRKCLMQFGATLVNSDPLLKWPAHLKVFGDLLDKKNCDPQFIIELVLKSMRISVKKFVLGEEDCNEDETDNQIQNV